MSQSRKDRRAQVRKDRKAERRSPHEPKAQSSLVTRNAIFVYSVLVIGVIAALVHLGHTERGESNKPKESSNPVRAERALPSLERLVEMPDSELASLDLAAVNLICSESLPGRELTGTDVLLDRLSQIEVKVRLETARNYYRFAANPAEFDYSEELFKILILNTVVGQDFGLRYNPDKVAAVSMENILDQSFFENADDVFLSGLLGDRRIGTCSSMPVLLTALGRRLGYPMKLVAAKGHLFCRWDNGTVRRNFECTNGVSSYSDAHYQKWPFPLTDAEVEAGFYLKSLSPREELAVFFSLRGQVFRYHGRIEEAVAAHTQANALHPNHPDYQTGLLIAQQAMQPWLYGDTLLPYSTDYHFRNKDPFAEVRDVIELNAQSRHRRFEDRTQAEQFLQRGGNGRLSPVGVGSDTIYASPPSVFPR